MAEHVTYPSEYSINKINRIHPVKIGTIIAVIAGFLFIPCTGSVHLFDWDEINFAEAAREMLVTGDFLNVQINYHAFPEKPPLFIWMQALSMKIFGVNEFAARFPNALCGMATLTVLFLAGRTLRNNLFGIIWTLAFAGSVLPFFYFKSGIIDPWFNLFIFQGIWFLFRSHWAEKNKKNSYAVLSGLFTGLAVLTKGPVALMLIVITFVFFGIHRKFRTGFNTQQLLYYTITAGFIGGSWFITRIIAGQEETVVGFIRYQIRLFSTKDAGHGGFPGYHMITLLLTVFPSSIMALGGFQKSPSENEPVKRFSLIMKILFFVVLIIFSVVRTKIVHYTSLAYFPLSFLAAHFVWRMYEGKTSWKKWMSVLILFISFLYSGLAIMISFTEQLKDDILAKGWISHPFVLEKLKNSVHWSGYEWIAGLLFALSVVMTLIIVKPNRIILRSLFLWCCTLLFTFSSMTLFTPKIEKYLQYNFIQFLKSKSGENVYFWNYQMRSYATWFYGQTQPPPAGRKISEEWLLTGETDREVYFVTKIHRARPLEFYNDIKKAGEADGYVFYHRKRK